MVHQAGVRADRGNDAFADFGIIGCGRFGSWMAEHLSRRGRVRAFDPRWFPDGGWRSTEPVGAGTHDPICDRLSVDAANSPAPAGVEGVTLPEAGPRPDAAVPSASAGFERVTLPEACAARVVIYAVPISALEASLRLTRPYLRPGTMIADTASVKVWPCRWLSAEAPPDVEIIGTHPLFGPDSAPDGPAGHRIAFVPIRLRRRRSALRFLRSLGLQVIETTAAEHDREMAATQSLVHWLARALARIEARPHDMDTLGYRRLLEILGHVTRDSWDLYRDLQRWNPYAHDARERLLATLTELHQEITDPTDPSRSGGAGRG